MSWRLYLRQLRHLDWLMLGAMALLVALSLAALYGIGASLEEPSFDALRRQAAFTLLGVAVMATSFAVPPQRWRQYALPLYGFGVLLLAAVLVFGQTRRGTTGWFGLGSFTFQPVELAKITLLLFLARLVESRPVEAPQSWRFLTWSGLATAGYCVLALLQPDFGSAALLAMLWVGMVILVGVPVRQAMILGAGVLVVAAVGWTFLLQDYQRGRVLAFLNPAADPYGRGYQVRQAIIAVGAGRAFGRGLGFGSQSQLKFLPAAQTDFLFAVIAEELGLVGVTLMLSSYLVIFYRLVSVAQRCRDDFLAAVAYGISVLLFSQVTINIGMNLGLLPVTGIGLPLLSYGGSYLLATFAMLGIAQRLAVASVKYPA